MKTIITAIALAVTSLLVAQEDTRKLWSSGRPDGHAPISIMGDHMHGKGQWMFSYRYMYMNMEDLKRGNDNASTTEALNEYMVTPVNMPMNMHMLGAMFAPTDRLTLMTMVSVSSRKMDHVTRMGTTFTTEASGLGDIRLSGLYKLLNGNRQTLHGQIGISIPTGSVTEQDVTPASAPNETQLPYPMQLGSGTLDAQLGLTYLGQADLFSWGSQINTTFRFGKNEHDFRFGNNYSLNNWVAYKATSWLSTSLRLEGLISGEIDGADPNLNPMMVITADPQNSGGTFINSGIGVNTYVSEGTLKNLRFGIEISFPLYQDVNGIQLKTNEGLVLGMQYSF